MKLEKTTTMFVWTKAACSGLLLTMALVWGATPGEAQNLITNGDFDANVTGWLYFSDRFDWVSSDGTAPSGNGCAEMGDFGVNGATVTVDWNTAIPVNPSSQYTISASLKMPSGSLATSAWMFVKYLDSTQTYFGEEVTPYYSGFDLADNAWHSDFSYQLTTPNYAHYVWISIGAGLPSGGSGETVLRWDNVSLVAGTGPTAQIFADGFESGDTTAWSDTVPSP